MAEPIPRPTRMTFADAAQLDPDEHPGELVEGEWIPVTRSTYRHAELLVNVAAVLKGYVRRHPEWAAVGGDPGTKVKLEPATLRGPDLAVLRRDRMPSGRGEQGWLEGAPEVVVEILGDAQSMSRMLRKTREYLQAGARLVLLLDPDSEELVAARPPDHFVVLGRDEVLDAGDVLPGFTCPVAGLFE